MVEVRSVQAGSAPATLILEHRAEDVHEPDSVSEAPLVGFDAFLPDRRIHGYIRLSAERMTDLLNAHDQLALVNVQVEWLGANGRTEVHDRILLARDDLVAVRAGGPRGDPALRRPMRRHPLAVRALPFLMTGYLHAPHGLPPLVEIESRPAMTPLSSASLEYWAEGQRRLQWSGTILFNRARADSIEVVRDEDLEYGQMGIDGGGAAGA